MRVLLQRIVTRWKTAHWRNENEKISWPPPRLLSGFFGGEFFDFFHQRVNDLRFGNFANHFAFFEDETDALAAGDAEIGGARFARTVDFATHNRNVDVKDCCREAFVLPPLLPARRDRHRRAHKKDRRRRSYRPS